MNEHETNSTTESENGTSSTMTVMDLNMECHLKIFSNLSLADLARASEVCHLFKFVAVETFKRQWKRKTIRVGNQSTICRLQSTAILRNFGSHVENLQCVFDKQGNDKLLIMIHDECGSNLKQLDFSSTCYDAKLKKVLNKNNIRRLIAKFVNLKKLRFNINTDDITKPKCIEQHFPSLEELSIFGYPFVNQNVQRFAQLNPQLKSLCFYHSNNVRDVSALMETLHRQLPQLEELGLWVHGNMDEIEYKPRFLNNLKHVKVKNCGSSANLQHLAISNQRVTTMELEPISCDEKLIDFVCEYKELNKLVIRLHTGNSFDCNFLHQLSEHLPKLIEVEIVNFRETINHLEMVRVVHWSKELFKLTVEDVQRNNMHISNNMHTTLDCMHSSPWVAERNSTLRHLKIFLRTKTP